MKIVEQSKIKWRSAWRDPVFKKKFIIGIVSVLIVLTAFPFFYQYIEKRDGIVLNDWILHQLPARNVSIPILVISWGICILLVIRAANNPSVFLVFLISYVLVSLCRIITITFIPLNPPPGLISLPDPVSNLFYGGGFVTKDLFFSGHTSSLFLVYLCVEKKSDRLVAGLGTLIIGFLLLVQHIHYTIDVVAAPFFSYLGFWLAKRWITGRTIQAD